MCAAMLMSALQAFLTIWAICAMIISAFGILLVSHGWISADLFGKSVKVDGVEKPIDWETRANFALLIAGFGLFFVAGAWLYSNDWVVGQVVGYWPAIPVWAWGLLGLAIWLFVTTLLNGLSGWTSLRRSFRKPHGEMLTRERLELAVMGKDVTCRNVLRISAYREGVGIEMSRWVGAFGGPVLVPWEQVLACPLEEGAANLVKVQLGEPERTSIVLTEESWLRIVQHRPAA